MHVLALEVFDDGGFAGGLVVKGDDMRRDRRDLGEAAGAQTPCAGDQFIAGIVRTRPHEDRLKHAMQPDARRELVKRVLGKGRARIREQC